MTVFLAPGSSSSGRQTSTATDEAEATWTTARYLSYFQGSLDNWTCADQESLRTVVPESRTQIYDIR